MKRLALLTLIICLPASLFSRADNALYAGGQGQVSTRYFPETGYSVRGRFLDYWQTHGMLSQQGYPISEEIQEISDTDGKAYTVQYFERAVFEWHPENQRPHDVLLSLLGVHRFRQKYPEGVSNQKPNYSTGSVLFPQTGRRVGGSFFKYWGTYGGLAQQGYPISDEIQERSDLDGKTYTMQYFERSVMEWHPGKTPPEDVLLSQLGTFRYQDKYAGATSTPNPPSSQIATGLIANNIRDIPVAAGHNLFYLREDGQNSSVYRFDLEQNREFLLTVSPGEKYNLATDGKIVVWVERQAESPLTIRGYDLNKGLEYTITQAAIVPYFEYEGLALNNSVLYYLERSRTSGGLYAFNIATGDKQLISARGSENSQPPREPVAADGILLWYEHERRDANYPGYQDAWTLHILKTDGSKGDTIIATQEGPYPFAGYSVSGDNIVWASNPINLADHMVYLYSISEGTSNPLITSKTGASPTSYGTDPLIKGSKVVWRDRRGGPCVVRCSPNADDLAIRAYDLDTGLHWTVIDYNSNKPSAHVIITQREAAYVAYTIRKADNVRDLYIISLEQPR